MEHEKLKLSCPHCKKTMIMSWETRQCIHCNHQLDNDKIKQVISNYEDRLNNNKFYRIGTQMEKVGDSMVKTGTGMSQMGCGCMSIVGFILFVILLLSLI